MSMSSLCHRIADGAFQLRAGINHHLQQGSGDSRGALVEPRNGSILVNIGSYLQWPCPTLLRLVVDMVV